MSRVEQRIEREILSAPLPVGRGLLWFGLLGGGGAWTLHLLSAYIIAEFGCISGLDEIRFAGITQVAWLILGASALMLLVAALVTLLAYRVTRRLAVASRDPLAAEDLDAEVYMARIGYITSGVFLLIILVQTVPVLYFLRSC